MKGTTATRKSNKKQNQILSAQSQCKYVSFHRILIIHKVFFIITLYYFFFSVFLILTFINFEKTKIIQQISHKNAIQMKTYLIDFITTSLTKSYPLAYITIRFLFCRSWKTNKF